MWRIVVAVVVGASMLTGCGRLGVNRKAQAETRFAYRAQLSKLSDPRDISIAVKAPGATVADVREAVRYEAVRYCLIERGSSDHEWETDPATGDWAYAVQGGDTLVFRARCRT